MQHAESMTLYVSTCGRDTWSGNLAEPAVDGADGPMATVSRARDIVREWKLTGFLAGPVTVSIRGGCYPLSRALVFGPDDSGPFSYSAYPGERPMFDGGMRIEGWRVENNICYNTSS